MIILVSIIILLIVSLVFIIQLDERWVLVLIMTWLLALFGMTIDLAFPDADYSNYSVEQLSESQVGKETKITDITDLQVATLIDENKEEGKCQISYTKDGDSMKINVAKENVVVHKSETGKPYIIKSKVKKDATTMKMLFDIFTVLGQKDTVYQVFEW